MTTTTWKWPWALAAAALVTGAVFGCDGGGGTGGAGTPACLAPLYPGGSACVACLESECPAGIIAFQTGCAAALACICPAGFYDPAAEQSGSCSAQLQQPSCLSAFSDGATAVCASCAGACADYGTGSSSGSNGSSSGGIGVSSSSGSSSGSGAGDDGDGDDGGNPGAGSSSSSGSGAGACDDAPTCSSSVCADGSTYQFCTAGAACCYWVAGGEQFMCASCSDSDIAGCVQLSDLCP
ncbi:MAG TPA: hypothetical protein VGL81_29430 [Polyangiaceae bacterium]|jgi:hypothetical protein